MKTPKFKHSTVKVLVHVSGEGIEAHEFEHCPLSDFEEVEKFSMAALTLKELGDKNNWPKNPKMICRIRKVFCNFGLTEIHPPEDCPMRSGKFLSEITMGFSIIERNSEKANA